MEARANIYKALAAYKKAMNAEKAIKNAVGLALTLVEAEALKLIGTGDTKAIDTGLLRSTISKDNQLKVSKDAVSGNVGAATRYALYVHEGFKHWKSKRLIKGRPFLRRALENKFKNVSEIIKKTIDEHMKDSAEL